MRKPRPRLERYEQADGIKLLGSLGARVYVVGTKRRKGDYQGTMQTPGIPDVHAFLPVPKYGNRPLPWGQSRRLLHWEVKSDTGRPSPPQDEYRVLCQLAGVWHVTGNLNALLAALVEHGYIRADQLTAQRQAVITVTAP
jgi:hypothetical protein